MIDVAICQCQKVARVPNGLDFGEAHERMVAQGWAVRREPLALSRMPRQVEGDSAEAPVDHGREAR